MKAVLKQGTLELPTVADTKKTERGMGLINSIDVSMVGTKHMVNEEGVHSYHSTCNHPGIPCGDEYHRGSGHGYCYYCSLSN